MWKRCYVTFDCSVKVNFDWATFYLWCNSVLSCTNYIPQQKLHGSTLFCWCLKSLKTTAYQKGWKTWQEVVGKLIFRFCVIVFQLCLFCYYLHDQLTFRKTFWWNQCFACLFICLLFLCVAKWHRSGNMSTFLHFRYFTVNKVLDQVLSSDATGSIFIQLPEVHVLTDKDSVDKTQACNQLGAPRGRRVFWGGHIL